MVARTSYDVEGYDPEANVAGQTVVEPPAFESEPADWRVAVIVDGRSTGVRMRLTEDAESDGCYPVEFELRESEELMASYSVNAECDPGTTTDGA